MRPDPTLLAFDTSAAHCAAALLLGGKVVTRIDPMQRGQAERLMPFLQELLAENGLAWADLSAVAVGIGPGNFTGIRIGVAAARGLALGLNVPAIGVSTPEAMAFGRPRPVDIALPAPRDQHYAQTFDSLGAGTVRLESGPATAPDWAAILAAMPRIAAERLASGEALPRPAPLYVRPADAAPSADPPPVILP